MKDEETKMSMDELLDKCYELYKEQYEDVGEYELYSKKDFKENLFSDKEEMEEILFDDPELYREWHNTFIAANQEELLEELEDLLEDYFSIISNEQPSLNPNFSSPEMLISEATEYESEIEFPSDLGEDVVEIVHHDGTIEGFLEGLKDLAENYDPEDHAEMYINMRGQQGVPDVSIRELIDDAEGIKKNLQDAADVLAMYVSGKHIFARAERDAAGDALVTNLDVKLTLNADGGYQISVYEPETGECVSFETDKDKLMETLSGRVADELLSWCSLLEDKALEQKETEELERE